MAVLAAVAGSILGLLTFAAAASLWQVGMHAFAGTVAHTVLVLTVGGMALAALAPPRVRLRGVRIPVERSQRGPQRPQTQDAMASVAICLGAPLSVASVMASLLFR
jgi:hypothetical protein